MFDALLHILPNLLGVALLCVIVLVAVLKFTTKPYPRIVRQKNENEYLDPETVKLHPYPSIEDPPTLDLSVIVPAYNEEKRLPAMLDECLAFLEERAAKDKSFTYEVIIVSDGSIDSTVSVGISYCKKHGVEHVRVMELLKNRGKGGAVRLGMLSARGRTLLFADADGATKFADYDKLAEGLNTLTKDWEKDAVAIGSRAHLEKEAIATRSLLRTILMHGFHFLVWLFAVRSIRDTQCGFKLLTRSAARKLFYSLHVERWAFDVELLYLAELLKMPMCEIAVRWTEIEGSKLTPFWSWIQMGIDLLLIWLRYVIGAWKVAATKQNSKLD